MVHLEKSRQELYVPRWISPAPASLARDARTSSHASRPAGVNIDYHVEYLKHYYSVPYTLIHEEVTLRVTERTVEILHKNGVIATHPRSDVPGRYTTQPTPYAGAPPESAGVVARTLRALGGGPGSRDHPSDPGRAWWDASIRSKPIGPAWAS